MGLPAVNHIAARARLCDRASGWAPLTAIERWRCGPPGPAKVAPSPAATNRDLGELGRELCCYVLNGRRVGGVTTVSDASGSLTFVPVMQSTDLRDADDVAGIGTLHGPRLGSIFVQ